jgi:hypothetical protein
VEVDVTITTAGAGVFDVQATLPVTAAVFNYAGSSREIAVTGKSGGAVILSAAPSMLQMRDGSGATYIANGARVIGAVTYELP